MTATAATVEGPATLDTPARLQQLATEISTAVERLDALRAERNALIVRAVDDEWLTVRATARHAGVGTTHVMRVIEHHHAGV